MPQRTGVYPLFLIVSLVPHSTRPAVNAWEVVVAQGNESLDQRDRDRERERTGRDRDREREGWREILHEKSQANGETHPIS